MSKRKSINELSIMKKEMTKHLKKDMKDEMTRYKDDKDEIRRLVREGTLKGRGLKSGEELTTYDSATKFSPGDIVIIKDNPKVYRALFNTPLNDFDRSLLEKLGEDNPELKKNTRMIRKEKKEKEKKISEEKAIAEYKLVVEKAEAEAKAARKAARKAKPVQVEQAEEITPFVRQSIQIPDQQLVQNNIQIVDDDEDEQLKIKDYNITYDPQFQNIQVIGHDGQEHQNNWKLEEYLLLDKIQNKLIPLFGSKLIMTSRDDNIVEKINNYNSRHQNPTYKADIDFIQYDFMNDDYFIDAKYYNTNHKGSVVNIGGKTIDCKGSYANILSNYNATYKPKKDNYEIRNGNTKGFDKEYQNSKDFQFYIPLTVAKIETNMNSVIQVHWDDNGVRLVLDKINLTSSKKGIIFIFSYTDGLFYVDITKLPFFNKTTYKLDLKKDNEGAKDFMLPPTYLKKIKIPTNGFKNPNYIQQKTRIIIVDNNGRPCPSYGNKSVSERGRLTREFNEKFKHNKKEIIIK
tara:strand:- start:790 stop:2337 length:1548 start_codon:yes stop_codon:yes gene_type:complete